MVVRMIVGTIDLMRSIGTNRATDGEPPPEDLGRRIQQERGRSICTGAWMESFPMDQEPGIQERALGSDKTGIGGVLTLCSASL